jgi:hypothetical protein
VPGAPVPAPVGPARRPAPAVPDPPPVLAVLAPTRA